MTIETPLHSLGRHTTAIRAVLIPLIALLLGLTAVTFVKFVSSPTDENLFADPRAKMTLVIVDSIHAEVAQPVQFKSALDSDIRSSGIQPGDLVNRVNRHPVLYPGELRQALDQTPPDSMVFLEMYRPGRDVFIAFRALRSAIPDTAVVLVDQYVVVRDVTPGGASDRAGMHVGDLIVSINGQRFKGAPDADRILRRGQTGKSIVYDVLRGGRPLALHVVLARFGIPPAYLILFLSGMFMMCVGAFISLKRPSIPAARAVGLMLLILGFFVSLVLIRKEPDRDLFVILRDFLLGASLLYGAAFIVWSSTHFPVERTDILAKKWFAWVLFCSPLVFLALGAAFGGYIILLGGLLIIIFAIVIRIVYRKKLSGETKKMRGIIKWTSVAVGGLISAGVATVPLHGVNTAIGFTGFVLLAIPLSHLYVIARYRLLELNLRVRRNVQYSVLSVFWGMLLAALFVFVFLRLADMQLHLPAIVFRGGLIEVLDDPQHTGGGEWTNRILVMSAGVVLWYLLWRLRRKGQNLIDKKYFRTRYDYRRAVNELGEVLASRLTMADLGKGLAEKLAELMHVRRAGVFFFEQGTVSSCFEAFGIDRNEWITFCTPVEKDLAAALTMSADWVRADYLPPHMQEAFKQHEFSLLVPVRSKGRLLGVMVLGEKLSEATYRTEDYEFLSAATAQVSVAMENAFLYEELAEKERLKHELEIARRIQMQSLPQNTPAIKGLDIAGISIPAMEVGGDFFDYLNGSTDRLTIVVGDVSGKGTSAALYMAKVQGILRSLHGFDLSPGDLFIRANRLLCGDLEKRSFVTAVGAAFQPGERKLVLARAGHLPLYHLRAGTGTVVRIIPRGLGLGLENAGVFASEIEEKIITYAKDDVLLFITDGVTEAEDTHGDQFGEDRLASFLREHGSAESKSIRDALLEEINGFMGGNAQHDDATIVVVKGT